MLRTLLGMLLSMYTLYSSLWSVVGSVACNLYVVKLCGLIILIHGGNGIPKSVSIGPTHLTMETRGKEDTTH